MRKLLLALGCALLAACATTGQGPVPTSLATMTRWQVDGKIAIRFGNESQSGYLNWQQHTPDYTIRLSGPLGQGASTLTRSGDQVTLEADGRTLSAGSAEELMQTSLGWSFPVSEMHWWVRGLASPNYEVDAQQMNTNGQLAELQQQGWTIEYLRYQPLENLSLPYKLVASRDQLRLTLILKNWQF